MLVGYQIDIADAKLNECEHQTKGKMERERAPARLNRVRVLQLDFHDCLFYKSTTNQTNTDNFRMITLS